MKKITVITAILFLCASGMFISGCSTCAGKGGQSSLKDKNRTLRSEIKDMANAQKKEKADMYMELGAAYTKAKDFKSAIDAYKKSLEFNPENAEAHYNLGLLYQRYQENTKKALYHFNKFLKLNHSPKAEREVKYLIKMLRSGRDWDLL